MASNYSVNVALRFAPDPGSLRQVEQAVDALRRRVAASPVDVQVRVSGAGSLSRVAADLSAVSGASTAAATSAAGLGAALARAGTSAAASASAFAATARTLRGAADGLRDGAAQAEQFGQQVALAGRRFLAFSAATAGLFAGVRALRAMAGEAVAFDATLNKLQQVSDESAASVRRLGSAALDLAAKVGVSSRELLDATLVFRQAGLSLGDTQKAMEAVAATSLAPNFDSMKQTSEGAVAAFQQFGRQADQLKAQLGAMNAVAGGFAVEAGDLVTATQKAGGVFAALNAPVASAKQNFNDFLGLFTAVRATTRESADSIATGLRTIFARVERDDTVKAMKDLGVELRVTAQEAAALGQADLAGQFVGTFEAVRRLSAGLGELRETDPRFAAALKQLGGDRQLSKVIPLLKEFGEAQKAVNVARVGEVSLAVNQEQAQKRLETRLTRIREEYQKFASELTQTSGFQTLASALEGVARNFADVLRVAAPLAPVLAGIAGGAAARGLTSFASGALAELTAPRGGRVLRRAAGGPVSPADHDPTVPGGPRGSDTVAAWLTPGEYVLDRDTVRNVGAGNLERLRRARGRVQYRRDGGYVFGDADVQRLLDEYSASTGVDLRQLIAGDPDIVDALKTRKGETGRGKFDRSTGRVTLSRAAIGGEADLRRTLLEEVFHGGDFAKTGSKLFAHLRGRPGFEGYQSEVPGTVEANAAAAVAQAPFYAARGLAAPAQAAYLARPRERLAKGLAEYVAGGQVGGAAAPLEMVLEKLRGRAPFQYGRSAVAEIGLDDPAQLAELRKRVVAFARNNPGVDKSSKDVLRDAGVTSALAAAAADIKIKVGEDVESLRDRVVSMAVERLKGGGDRPGGADAAAAAVARDDVRSVDRRLDAEEAARRTAAANRRYEEDRARAAARIAATRDGPEVGVGDTAGVTGLRTTNPRLLALLARRGRAPAAPGPLALVPGGFAGEPPFQDPRLPFRGPRVSVVDGNGVAAFAPPGGGPPRLPPAPPAASPPPPDGPRWSDGAFPFPFAAAPGTSPVRFVNRPRGPQADPPPDGPWQPPTRDERLGERAAYQERERYARAAAELAARRQAAARMEAGERAARGPTADLATGRTEYGLLDLANDRFRGSLPAGPLSGDTRTPLAADGDGRLTGGAEAFKELDRQQRRVQRGLYEQARRAGASRTEARRLAAELAEQAAAVNAGVQTDARGRATGLTADGLAAVGRPDLAERFGRGGDARGRFARLVDRLSGPTGRLALGGREVNATAAALGFGAAAGYAGEAAAPSAALARNIGTGQAGVDASFRAQSGAAGALQGAALGAGVGAAWGGVGAVVGAGVGALAGFVAAVRDAADKLRDAKIGNAVDRLGDAFRAVAQGRTPYDRLDAGEFSRNVATLQQEARAGAAKAAGGLFSAGSPQEQLEAYKREIRLAAGPQLFNLFSGVQEAAGRAGKADAARPAADGEKPEAVARRGERLLADSPVARDSVSLLVDLGVYKSTADAVRELGEEVLKAARAERVRGEVRKAAAQDERAEGALGRLAGAAVAAAQGADRPGRRAEAGAAVAGLGQAPGLGDPAAALAEVGLGGDPAALVARFRGAPGGAAFAAQLQAVDAVARELPAALGEALRAGPKDEESAAAVERLLLARVGPGAEERAAAESAVSALRELLGKNTGSLKEAVGGDLGGVVRQLVGGRLAPLQRDGEAYLRRRGAAEQGFSSGLAQAEGFGEQARRADAEAAGAGLTLARLRAERAAERRGTRAVDELSLGTLNGPFAARQAGLGAAGLSAERVAGRLRALGQDAERLSGEREDARADPERFKRVEAEFQRVVSESDRLRQALANLGNAAERTAGLQEKLAAATAAVDARRDYAERLVMADPAERGRLRRDERAAAAAAANPDGFAALPRSQQQAALRGLGAMGDGFTLPDGRDAGQVRRQLLDRLTGQQGAGERGTRDGLRDQLGQELAAAAAAQKEAARLARDGQTAFLANLQQTFDRFLAGLAKGVAEEDRRQAVQRKVGLEAEGGELEKQRRAAGVLAGVGVADDAGLDALRKNKDKLSPLFEAERRAGSTDKLQAAVSRFAFDPAVAKDYAGLAAEVNSPDYKLGDMILRQFGGDPENDAAYQRSFSRVEDPLKKLARDAGLNSDQETLFTDVFRRNVANDNSTRFGPPEERQAALRAAARSAAEEATRLAEDPKTGERRDARRELDRLKGELSLAGGVGGDKLLGLGAAGQKSLTDALAAFTGGKTLDGLTARQTENSKALDEATAALRRFNAALGGRGELVGPPREEGNAFVGPVRGFAAGGVVEPAALTPYPVPPAGWDGTNAGVPAKGVDTVPAVLQPGEAVIPKGTVAANRGLVDSLLHAGGQALHRVNPWRAAKGFAAGGVVGEDPRRDALALAQDQALVDAVPADLGRATAESAPARARGAMDKRVGVWKAQEAARADRRARERGLAALDRAGRAGDGELGVAFGQQAFDAKDRRRGRRAEASLVGSEQRDFARRALAADAFAGDDSGTGRLANEGYAARADNPERSDLLRQFADRRLGDRGDARRRRSLSRAQAAAAEGARRDRAEAAWRRWRNPTSPEQDLAAAAPGARQVGPVWRFASGGPVPGSALGDKTPALLEGGEFVLNRQAAQRIGAGNLAQANSGQGGTGGPAVDSKLGEALREFAQKADPLAAALAGFAPKADKLAEALEKLPEEIELKATVQHTHTHNGLEAFRAAEGAFKKMAEELVHQAITDRVPGATLRS